MPINLIGESNLVDLIDGADVGQAGWYSYRRVMGQNVRSFNNQKTSGIILPCHDLEPVGGVLIPGKFDTDVYTLIGREAEVWLLGY